MDTITSTTPHEDEPVGELNDQTLLETNDTLEPLLTEASRVTSEHFPNKTNFAKCFFLSWYCSVGDCTFCYRSTIKNKIDDPAKARRTIGSVFVEALLAKKLGWEIEFITGGYGIYPVEDIVEITRGVSLIYGEKVWVNFGAMSKKTLELLQPYVLGVVASIETINPSLRAIVTPSKPMSAYLQLYQNAGNDFLKSCTFIVGLGEKEEDLDLLHAFVRDNKLDRITFYALHPIKGTPFTQGPTISEYAWWVAKTRIAFPRLEIVAGTIRDGPEHTGTLLRAGANLITKFAGLKKFGSEEARRFEAELQHSGRTFTSNLMREPSVDWDAEISQLPVEERYKTEMRKILPMYLKKIRECLTKPLV